MDKTKLDSSYQMYLSKNKIFKFSVGIFLVSFSIALISFSILFSNFNNFLLFLIFLLPLGTLIWLIICWYKNDKIEKEFYSLLKKGIFKEIKIKSLLISTPRDVFVSFNSRRALDNYTEIKFFKEHPEEIDKALKLAMLKKEYFDRVSSFIYGENEFKKYSFFYRKIEKELENSLAYNDAYYIFLNYDSPSGRVNYHAYINVSLKRLIEIKNDKSLLMTKSEYNKYLKDEEKRLLSEKQTKFYDKTNEIIDYCNNYKDSLIISDSKEKLDELVSSLFDKTINGIKKIKTSNSEERTILDKFIKELENSIKDIVKENKKILDYYESEEFKKIKDTCSALMESQKEFNDYIDEKVKSISNLFGQNTIRNETVFEDEYNYIHPYKKTINPFVAELSANVFASAENKPIEYILKSFYPNKELYPEQIQKLQTLIEELETLKDAKEIIENYKREVKEYLSEVPSYVMENDESGFYSRLGFATINEKALTIKYKFSYTSGSGHAQRSFSVPMTEETIINLINALENKLTMASFTKEQRSLMTRKLRLEIQERDNYTCQICGNSISKEPNLLLEIDHIVPVSKGGLTKEENLQTLCWRCNRSKSDKIIN